MGSESLLLKHCSSLFVACEQMYIMPKCLPEFGDAESKVTATDDEAFSHLNQDSV